MFLLIYHLKDDGQGDEAWDKSPAEDISNLQCVNLEAFVDADNGQQFTSFLSCATNRNGECYNQQVNFFHFLFRITKFDLIVLSSDKHCNNKFEGFCEKFGGFAISITRMYSKSEGTQ